MDRSSAAHDHRVAVVIATRDRAGDLDVALRHLTSLPERPHIVVVDNASTDSTVALVRRNHPTVEVVALEHNRWGGARSIGAARAGAPYVAFSDDDSWWGPGSLARAADLLDAHPRLGLVAGRVLVGSERRLDPTCVAMSETPLPQNGDLSSPAILGFLACGAVVRRETFLGLGGFDHRFEIGGEEELFALDLASAGWGLHYADDVVAHHHPSTMRDASSRRRRQMRNLLWSAWLRRPPRSALARSGFVLRRAMRDPMAARALIDAVRGLPWVVKDRRLIHPELAAALARLEA
ncbi:MAG: glycosyltransferase family 2 protein [Actinomycetota bacterium]